ncbi:3-hydroxyisobutyrate dehydrogenase [Rhodococcus koreensis]
MSVITWIGLGNMGLPMAQQIVREGHEVRGVEINPVAAREAEVAGIRIYSSAVEAIEGADAVITMLPTGAHVRELLAGPNGLFSAASKQTLFVDSSTIDIDSAKELHALAAARDLQFVDAPVSGGVVKAAAGTLTFMIGGSPENFAAASPFVAPMAAKIVYAGGPGTGQAAKIVNNMICGICLAATCEGLLLGERLGLDADVFYDIAVSSSAENFALREWYPAPGVVTSAPSSNDYAPGFTGALLLKDLSLALQAGQSTDTALDTAHTVHALFEKLVDDGAGGYDCTALLPALAGRLGPGLATVPSVDTATR